MKKDYFTPSERRQIYLSIAKMIWYGNFNSGVCILLGSRMSKGYFGTPDEDIEAAFPEFFLFRPKHYSGAWWDDPKSFGRLNALLFAAEMTKDAKR